MIKGKYHPPKSPVEKEAYISFTGDKIKLAIKQGKTSYHQSDNVKISTQLAKTNKKIQFDDGGLFICENNPNIEEYQQTYHRRGNLLHRLERSAKISLGLLVVAAIFIWGFVTFGLPKLSLFIAYQLPISVQKSIGANVLKILDKTHFKASKLTQKEKDKITKIFNNIKNNLPEEQVIPPKLYFRYGNTIGANALAIPDGSIIVTDEFVKFSKKTSSYEDALYGVLAHEIGHLYHRHSLQAVISASIVPILLTVIGGDLIDSSQMAIAIPGLLLQMGYGRDFERQADEFARNIMVKNNVNTTPTGEIFQLLAKQEKNDGKTMQILQTHPNHNERMKFFSVQP
jgi:Zn-dependent protease with chaperone function